MKRVLRNLTLCVVGTILVAQGFACNTTEGLGKDTKAAGQGIENAANNNK